MSGMGGGVVSRSSTRMAPAPAGGVERSVRRTFAVGKLSWRRSEIRLVEARRLARPSTRNAGAETVH
jgi:hypothetical protein